jgi:heptosyltransferase II
MTGAQAAVEAKRILIRCPNWLGDVVMVTPALRALRRRFPDAKIVAHLPAALAPVLVGLDLCDEVWPVSSRAGGVSGWRRDVKLISNGRFDLGLVVPESISSALLMRLGSVARVIGFARDPLRGVLLHQELVADAEWGRRRLVSKERYAMRLVAAVGAESEDLQTSLRVTVGEKNRLASALTEIGVEAAHLERERPVVLAPGAGFGEAKCWPSESFAELGDRLAEGGQCVVLLGAPGEHTRIEAVRATMKSRPIVLDGILDVGGLKALLENARALVANDAGARHVAAAFGVPSVIFFGPTSVAKTADNLELIQVLETEHDCRPCYRRRCPIDHRCLRSIEVDEAAVATERALRPKRSFASKPVPRETRA